MIVALIMFWFLVSGAWIVLHSMFGEIYGSDLDTAFLPKGARILYAVNPFFGVVLVLLFCLWVFALYNRLRPSVIRSLLPWSLLPISFFAVFVLSIGFFRQIFCECAILPK